MWYIFPIDRRGATDAQLHSDVLSFANQRLFFNDMKSLALHTFLSQECLTNKALFVGNILFVFNIVHSSPAEKKIQTVLSLLFRWWIFKTLIVIYFIDYGHKALRNMETKMIVILVALGISWAYNEGGLRHFYTHKTYQKQNGQAEARDHLRSELSMNGWQNWHWEWVYYKILLRVRNDKNFWKTILANVLNVHDANKPDHFSYSLDVFSLFFTLVLVINYLVKFYNVFHRKDVSFFFFFSFSFLEGANIKIQLFIYLIFLLSDVFLRFINQL